MKVTAQKSELSEIQVPVILVGVSEDADGDRLVEQVQEPLKKMIKDVIALGDFTGKKGDTSLIYTQGAVPADRVFLVGLGKSDKLTVEDVRKTLGEASRKVRDLGIKRVGVSLDHFSRGILDEHDVAEAMVESFIMGSYQNVHYQTKDLDKFKRVEELVVFSPDGDLEELEKRASSGKVIGEAVNLCRTLAWRPGNYVTPTKLAEEAERLEELGVKTRIIDREEAKEIGPVSYTHLTLPTSDLV